MKGNSQSIFAPKQEEENLPEVTEKRFEFQDAREMVAVLGETDEYLKEHFVVVRAKYYVGYDHTKTFLDDGYTEQYFYLTQDIKSGEWTISDNTSPNILS